MEKRILTEQELVSIDKFIDKGTKYSYIYNAIFIVQKCNFNDEWLVKSRYFKIEEFINKPLVWFDLFDGFYKNGNIKFAFTSVEEENLFILVDDGKQRILYKLDNYDLLVEDNDKTTLVSSKFSMSEKKESWWQ